MANSGIIWIDRTFDWCVIFLYNVARLLNISYEEINVWLFVILIPVIFFILASLIIYQALRYSNLKKEYKNLYEINIKLLKK